MATILEILGDAKPSGDVAFEDSSLRKGFRSGVTGAESQLHSLVGTGAEALGLTDFAKGRYARSAELQAQAEREAPPVRSYKDVTDLKSGYDYVTGLIGQSAPQSALALGGGLGGLALKGGAAALRAGLGSAAVLTPFEAGDITQRQQADPVSREAPAGERLLAAGAGGAGSAAVQSIVPGVVGAQIAGQTAKRGLTLGRAATRGTTLAGAEGATEATGEAIKQGTNIVTNPDLTLDPEALKEAAVGGVVAGGALAGVGGAAELAHGRAMDAGTTISGAVGDTLRAGKEVAYNGVSGLFPRSEDAALRAVAEDRPIEPLPEGVDPAAAVAQNDAKATDRATKWATEMLADSSLPTDVKATLGDLLARVAEPAARAEIATMAAARKTVQKATEFRDYMASDETRERVEGAKQRAMDLFEVARGTFKGVMDSTPSMRDQIEYAKQWRAANPQGTTQQFMHDYGAKFNIQFGSKGATKLSEDFAGARAVIARELIPAITKTNPAIASNPEAIDRVADAVRLFMNKAMKGQKPQNDNIAVAYLSAMVGPDAVATLARSFEAIHEATPQQRESMYDALQELDKHLTQHNELANTVRASLKDMSVDPNVAVEVLRRYTRGEHVKGMEGSVRSVNESLARREIESLFGKDTGKVLDAFQKEYEDSLNEQKLGQAATQREDGDPEGEDGNAAESGVADHSLEETDLEFEPPRRYLGQGKKPVLSLAAHRRDFGDTPSQVEKLLERAKKDNPDRNVSFLSAADFERDYGEKLNVPEGAKPEDYGVVVAEGQAQEGRITEQQAREMRLDSKKHAGSRARIDTDIEGVTLDAYKITKQTIKRMPYIEGESSMRRTARAFFEGLASAMIHYGAVPKVRDSTVIAVRGGAPVTYGDIKHYRGGGEFSTTAKLDLDSELKDMKRRMGKEADLGKRKLLLKDIEEIEGKIAARDSGKNTPSRLETLQQAHQVYEIDPEGNIHEAAMEHEKKGTLEKKHKDESSAATVHKGEAKAKPAAEAEHVAGRVKPEPEGAEIIDEAEAILSGASKAPTDAQVKTAVKNILAGSSLFDKAIAAFTNTPMRGQLLIKAINDSKIRNSRELRNANEAVDIIEKKIAAALKKSPEVAYAMQLKSSRGPIDPTLTASQKTEASIQKYIHDVLGGTVKARIVKMPHAGDFTFDPQMLIRVSVHALDPMGTAYHESLHAFFKHLRDQGNREVMDVLYRAAKTASVMNQLREFFKSQPEVLKQIETDLEERVAYMYQLYAKEKLNLGPETRNVFQRIKSYIMKTLGIWTNDQRAEFIMDYFHEGQFAEHVGNRNAVSKALMEPGTNKYWESVKRALEPLKRMEQAVLGTGAARLRDMNVPAIARIADLISPETGAMASDVGFIQATKNEHTRRMNKIAAMLKGYSQETLDAAHTALKTGVKRGLPPDVQAARDAVRAYLDEMYEYMRAADINVRDLGFKDDYFPHIYDRDYLSRHQDEFVKWAEAQGIKDANKALATIMTAEGAADMEMPGMQHLKRRKFENVPPEFLEKSLFTVLNNYTLQAARRAEWAKRFNPDNSGMKDLLKQAKQEGATQDEIDLAQDFVRAVDGTLGDDINPTTRRLFGNLIVYQNVRLLPLALFSSIVDPGGVLVRGGTIGDAFNTFKRGIMEIPRGFKKNKAKDEWYELAEAIGAIDDATLMNTVGTSYTQGMVGETARKINDKLFKFNMVEQFTTSMRVGATQAAVKFLAKHADGTASPHSERWLAELGFQPGDIIVKDGRPLIHEHEFKAQGMTDAQAIAAALRMKAAINKWVDGAILRPNSANKPIWMNDPHYALIAHLKQFVYAFQDTILKRAWHEAEHGNYGPALALAGYVPTMMAADFIKGLIQGGGEQPQWKKGWGFGQYFASGVERAGLYGVGQFSVDLMQDVKRGGGGFGVLGPTVEQLVDGIKVLGGKGQFEPFALRSLPANALYIHSLKADPTDPDFVR